MQLLPETRTVTLSRFRSLDSFRGIASLWIVFLHFFPPLIRAEYGPIASKMIEMGFIGTDIFFVLSGFVTSLAAQRILEGQRSLVSFIKDRFKRLYLTYLFCLLFGAWLIPTLIGALPALKGHPLSFSYPNLTLADWVQFLTLTRIFSLTSWRLHEAFAPLDVPIWFLAILFQIYLVFIIAILSKKHYYKILIGVTVLSTLCFIPGAREWVPYGLFLYKWLHFSVGIVLFHLLSRKAAPSFDSSRGRALYFSLFLLFLGMAYAVFHFYGSVSYQTGAFYNEYRLLSTLTIGLFFWLIYPFDARLSRTGLFRFFRFLGFFSYSTYLLHLPLLRLAEMIVAHIDLPAQISRVIILVPLVLFWSLLWSIFFEMPGTLSDLAQTICSPLKTLRSLFIMDIFAPIEGKLGNRSENRH